LGEVISLAYYVSIAAGASGKGTIWKVTPARKFRMKKAKFYTDSGGEGNVKAAIMRGVEKALPFNSELYVPHSPIELEGEVLYNGGENIEVSYSNEDGTNPHMLVVVVTGEIEEV